MNIIMSYFCFLSAQTVSFCGHIARYAPLSANILPSKQIQKSDSGNFKNPPEYNFTDEINKYNTI